MFTGLALRLFGLAAILGAIHGAFWYAKREGKQECERAHAVAVAAEFRQHVEAVAQVADEAQRLANRRVASRNAAGVASDRLRGELAGHGIVYHPAASASSPAATEAGDLSARLLDAADRRLRELAEYADEASAAGTACERIYDKMR
jgi:hypothetical protein